MKSFLKNYTTEVSVATSIMEIEQILIRCGVQGITKEYGPTGRVAAMLFHAPVEGRSQAIRLPAKFEEVQEMLWAEYRKITVRPRKTKPDFAEQAERIAWRLVKDWVAVQMSMISLRQSDFLEVFLSYVWLGHGRGTFYNQIKDAKFRALLPEKTEA